MATHPIHCSTWPSEWISGQQKARQCCWDCNYIRLIVFKKLRIKRFVHVQREGLLFCIYSKSVSGEHNITDQANSFAPLHWQDVFHHRQMPDTSPFSLMHWIYVTACPSWHYTALSHTWRNKHITSNIGSTETAGLDSDGLTVPAANWATLVVSNISLLTSNISKEFICLWQQLEITHCTALVLLVVCKMS